MVRGPGLFERPKIFGTRHIRIETSTSWHISEPVKARQPFKQPKQAPTPSGLKMVAPLLFRKSGKQ